MQMSSKTKTKYYAVAKGRETGIFSSWDVTSSLVKSYPGAKYKSFLTYEEASLWISNNQRQILPGKNTKCIYTDGSHINGCGGYGIVVVEDQQIVAQHSGEVPEYPTTNNRAELYAIWKALSRYPGNLNIFSDSENSINVLTGYTPTKNLVLIEKIDALLIGRQVSFSHVYGHTGNEYNELADELANQGRKNYGLY